jgi:hypothetical protein
MSIKALSQSIDAFAKNAQQTNFVLNPPPNKILADSWNNIASALASALAFKNSRPLDAAKAIQENLDIINKILAKPPMIANASDEE